MTHRNLSVHQHLQFLAARNKPQFRFRGGGKADWKKWRRGLLPKVRATLGNMPRRIALNPTIEAEWRHDGLITQRVIFDVEAGLSAVALICRPATVRGRLPAILACHGHGIEGKENVMGNRASPTRTATVAAANYDYGLQMAQAGFVTIAIDWRGFGERADRASPGSIDPPIWLGERDICDVYYLSSTIMGRTMLGANIHDGQCALDYLCRQKYVDPARIGVMGLSLGGTMATWLTICDERIQATDIICYSDRFSNFGIRDTHYCGNQISPGLFALADVPDLQGLIAPRPLLVEIGAQDMTFKVESAKSCFREVGKIYTAAGVRDRLELDLFAEGHRWGANKSLAFFRKHLGSPAPAA